jgi:hypothetical protein
MKRIHSAILLAQGLSYALIVTFILADRQYNFSGVLRDADQPMSPQTAYAASCLIALVGSINIWLTWYYATKSSAMRDMVVVCAWTHQIKANGRWMKLEEFFTEQLGFAVSHGMSTAKLAEMRAEVDRDWRKAPSIGFDSLQKNDPKPKPAPAPSAPLSSQRLAPPRGAG